jgi:signal transduction histidine kinase
MRAPKSGDIGSAPKPSPNSRMCGTHLIASLLSRPAHTRAPVSSEATEASGLAVIAVSLVISPNWLSGSAYTPVIWVVYGLCLYAVAVRCRPRIVAAAAIVTVIGAGFIDSGSAPEAVFLGVIPLLIGAVVRQRRSSERQLAEQELRHSGERALLEERQRIARELHDVVAHHMSVIAIQAEAAPYKIADPPPELVESFGDIRASALAGLGELRRVLGVLRTGGQSLAPQPRLADLDTLLDSARSGGVKVTATHSGNPVTLPDGVDLSAYRILQEALSNAMRHAPGSQVRLNVAYRGDGVALEVRNDAAPTATRKFPVAVTSAGSPAGGTGACGPPGPDSGAGAAGGGHGIIGMRERAAMLGGSLDAAPTDDGGFQVTAVLPMSSGDAS